MVWIPEKPLIQGTVSTVKDCVAYSMKYGTPARMYDIELLLTSFCSSNKRVHGSKPSHNQTVTIDVFPILLGQHSKKECSDHCSVVLRALRAL